MIRTEMEHLVLRHVSLVCNTLMAPVFASTAITAQHVIECVQEVRILHAVIVASASLMAHVNAGGTGKEAATVHRVPLILLAQ